MKSKKPHLKLLLFFALILVISVGELPLKALVLSGSSQVNQAQPILIAQSKKKRSTWQAILNLFKREKEPLLGSRGICLISPGLLEKENNIIWSDRPLFLWQRINLPPEKGTNLPLEIRLYSAFDAKQEQMILWRQDVTETSATVTFTGIQYQGTPLQPGKNYDWEIFNQRDQSKERRIFQVMGIEKRDRIAEELRSLENRLKAEKATNEEIVLERANYFGERGLLSDSLQELYTIQNPSKELIQNRQEILTNLCNSRNLSILQPVTH